MILWWRDMLCFVFGHPAFSKHERILIEERLGAAKRLSLGVSIVCSRCGTEFTIE